MVKGKVTLNGSHLMMDCFGCPEEKLGDEEGIRSFLSELPSQLSMRKLIEPNIVCYSGNGSWDKGGITGFMLIAESHVSIHTFPDYGFFSADVYSCKPFDTEKAIEIAKKYFQFTDANIKTAKRDIEIVRELNLAKKVRNEY